MNTREKYSVAFLHNKFVQLLFFQEYSALDFFHLLFTMNIVRTIVRETNRYAHQFLQA